MLYSYPDGRKQNSAQLSLNSIEASSCPAFYKALTALPPPVQSVCQLPKIFETSKGGKDLGIRNLTTHLFLLNMLGLCHTLLTVFTHHTLENN